MRKDLDDALVRDFPELFRDRRGDKHETLMCWGFDCFDGWEPIIRRLAGQLTFLAKVQSVPDLRAVQVKEKWGVLEFYLEGATDIMIACVSQARNDSSSTCEMCGEGGRLRGGLWRKTLCARHAFESDRVISDIDLGVNPYRRDDPNDSVQPPNGAWTERISARERKNFLAAVLHLGEAWRLTEAELAAFLHVHRPTLTRWKAAGKISKAAPLEQIDAALGIFWGVGAMFPNTADERIWMLSPHEAFGGRTPLAVASGSLEDLFRLRRYVDFVRERGA